MSCHLVACIQKEYIGLHNLCFFKFMFMRVFQGFLFFFYRIQILSAEYLVSVPQRAPMQKFLKSRTYSKGDSQWYVCLIHIENSPSTITLSSHHLCTRKLVCNSFLVPIFTIIWIIFFYIIFAFCSNACAANTFRI